MIIESSQVSYETQHRLTSTTVVTDQTVVRPRGGNTSASTLPAARVPSIPVDTVQLSSLAGTSGASDRDDLQDMDPKTRVAMLVIEALLGHKVGWLKVRKSATPAVPGPPAARANAAAANATEQVRQHTEVHSEAERSTFQAKGAVQTADGRSIQFAVSLTMERQERSFSVTNTPIQKVDPLVVNFEGAPAKLTDAKIAFDLNSDGGPEEISFVTSASGFLVLDANGDGKANDGTELFGPKTGDGFAELASYDQDHNGWIDEGDPVFTQLRIWTSDGLSTLAKKGIGALFTASAETPFELRDSSHHTQGEIRDSGIYLTEQGAAGTIQQVDLAVG